MKDKKELVKVEERESKEVEKRPVGRPPVEYNPELADKILFSIAEGHSLRKSINNLEGITFYAFYKWLYTVPEFSERYLESCKVREHVLADDILDISDHSNEDWVKTKNGELVLSKTAILRDKLRVDSRKWLLARLNPKQWGDRSTIEHLGNESNVNVLVDASGKETREEWEARRKKELESSQQSQVLITHENSSSSDNDP